MKKFLVSFLTFFAVFYLSAALYDTKYIGNSNTGKFHYATCSSVAKMNPGHQVPLATREEAVNKNFIPCKRCKP